MNVAVITTRNEAATIGWLVKQASWYVDKVIVVDEDSTDDTRSEAFDAGAHVYLAAGGIGACQRYGWARALETGADRIVQFDAGGSHDPCEIPTLLASPVELVIGSRFCEGGAHLGSWWRAMASSMYVLCSGLPYEDVTSGYRVLTAEVAEYLLTKPYRALMHGWQTEALRYAHDAGFTVAEVPIIYRPSRSSLTIPIAREALRVLR